MSINAGSAYIELEGKDKGALKLLDQVRSKTGDAEKSVFSLKKAFVALGGALVMKDIISTYSKFEQSVANAASVTGAFGNELVKVKKNISDVAKGLGKTTVFSANEAADALYDLASAGEDVANITQKDIKPILDLAAATGTALPQAMEQTLASMKQMGLGFEDVGAITDSLMATIASSPANMSRLRESWKQAAPIANTLGVDFNELNAALGTLYKKGFLQGEQAGTALRNMFTRLVPTTKTQVDALAALGLTAEEVSVEQHGLLGVLDNLDKAYSGLGDKTEMVANAKKMFGEEAAGAAIALIEEAGSARKLYESMELMKRKAEETGVSLTEMVAELQLDTLQGSLKLFQSNLESLKIAIGEVLAPIIRMGAEFLGSLAAAETTQVFIQGAFTILRETILGVVNVVRDLKNSFIDTFSSSNANWAGGFLNLPGVFEENIDLMNKLGLTVDDLSTKQNGNIGVLTNVANALSGVTDENERLAIAEQLAKGQGEALLAEIDKIQTKDEIIAGFNRGLEIVLNTIQLLLGYITDLGILAIKTFKKITDFVKEKWGGDLTDIFKNWWTYIKNVMGFFTIIFKGAYDYIVNTFNRLLPFWIELFDGIIKFAKGFMQILTGDFSKGFNNIWDGIVSFVKGFISIFWDGLKQIGGFITKLAGFLGRTFLKLAVGLGALWLDLVESSAKVFIAIIKNAAIFIKNLFNTTTDIDWGDVWSGMQEWFGKALDNIIKKAKEIGKKIKDFFKNVFAGDEGASLDGQGSIGKLSSGEKKAMLSEYENVLDSVDFSRTKAVLGSIGKDFQNTFFNVDTSAIEKEAGKIQSKLMSSSTLSNGNSINEQLDILDTLNAQNQAIEDQTKANEENNKTLDDKNAAASKGGAAAAKMSEEEKAAAEAKEEADKKSIKNYQEIGNKITDSIKRIQKYGETLQGLKEKFLELKKSAKGDIQELSESIAALDEKMKAITESGQKERDSITNNSDIALSERRLAILERQKELDQEIKDLRDSEDGDRFLKINELKEEEKNLAKELQIINQNVSQEIIKQVEELSKKTEAEKILLETEKRLAEQRAKEKVEIDTIKSERDALVEKKAISQAILEDRQIKIQEEGEILKAFYIDQNGKEVEITNFKNIQYAQDMENKRLAIQNQLLAVEEGIIQEQLLLQGFYDQKTLMEQNFTTVLQEEKAKQKIEIDNEIDQTRKAIKVWNEYWKAKKSGKGNASVGVDTQTFQGFKNGGFTGNVGVNEVAGLVHGKEYVIPNKVMQKLGGTGILDGLERLRKGFAGGGHTSSVPTVSNVNSPSLNVTQHIASGLDLQSSISEMGYLLRLRS